MTPLLFVAGAASAHPPSPVHRVGPLAVQGGALHGAAPGRSRAAVPALVPALVAVVVLAALVFDRASVVIAASAAAATALHLLVRRRSARVEERRRDAAATFLGHVATAMEAGAALPAALARAAEQLPQDAPVDLARDVAHLVHHATRASAFEARTPELARVQAVWSLASSHGIPLVRLVTTARDELDHARRHRAATRAALAGPAATAAILSLLPVAGVLMGTAMGANPIAFLAGGGVGGVLLIIGTALLCCGVLAAEAIIRRAAS